MRGRLGDFSAREANYLSSLLFIKDLLHTPKLAGLAKARLHMVDVDLRCTNKVSRCEGAERLKFVVHGNHRP